jgi:nucleotide-binding universal stress UspA family protein
MNVLVAVDLSDVSRKMLDAVLRIPRPEGMKVVIVYVAEPDPEFVGWDAGPGVVRDAVAAEFHRERHEVEAMATELREGGVDAVGLVVQGPTVTTILDEIERREADLLVVGSHGHGAAYDLTVGSISSGVIRKSTVPVLVIPDRT